MVWLSFIGEPFLLLNSSIKKEFLKLTISVLNFYSRTKESKVAFPKVLHSPTFYILAKVDGKLRELTLKLSGEVKCPPLKDQKDFSAIGCRDYLIITDFLLGENGERVRLSWGLTKEDFRELIFELYFALVKEYSTCGVLRKSFLLLFGAWKFFMGRKIK